MNNAEKLIVAFAIFVVLAGVFVAISDALNMLDLSTVPEWAKPALSVIVKYFNAGAIAFAVAWLRNLLGFFRNYIQERKTETIAFEMDRYYNTIIYYMGPFAVAMAAIPPPYNALGAAVVFIIDIFTAEWKKIQPSE